MSMYKCMIHARTHTHTHTRTRTHTHKHIHVSHRRNAIHFDMGFAKSSSIFKHTNMGASAVDELLRSLTTQIRKKQIYRKKFRVANTTRHAYLYKIRLSPT